ncbi:DNA polymerase III subunit gamma/tau [Halorhodospira halochloris]|uniref:DNA polymerase III subunit gamma/tau n=1 Tax=Halorhodospira halochloris TaxID=1052 RepID=UPI001EE84D61|nr:DNA polymerase III subunit gamma/tau [Halorhodospira halochloris]MCG5531243.1 DNA polymerase III subunit gamma/tau [Halorhodospira halochloris]
MTYQALARKWRPRRFEDVAGQEHVLRALSNALAEGRIHHAYLFSGTRGIGKTTVARILAKCLNCEEGITATPCRECPSCREIDQGRFVDLIEVDAASRTRVEDTRELLDNVQYSPSRGRFKVYIIDEVHMLSGSSFNALLKTLEEPPDHVKFLLATTDPQKLPVTVLSRCLQFHLRRLPSALICERLLKIAGDEGVEVDSGAALRLARAADGSMRDSLSLLDQALAYGDGAAREDEVAAMLGSLEGSQVLDIIEALAGGDSDRVVRAARDLAEQAADFDAILSEVVATVHTLALAQQAPGVIAEDEPERERLLRLAQQISGEDLQLYYQIGIHARRDLPYAPDPATGFEMALLRMLAFRPAQMPPRDGRAQGSGSRDSRPEDGGPGNSGGGSPISSAGAGRTLAQQGATQQQAGNKVQQHGASQQPAAPESGQLGGQQGAASAAADYWRNVVGQLDGMLYALASHCQWGGRDGNRITLHLDQAQRYLLNDERRQRLCEALQSSFGEGQLELRIEVMDTQLTPAQQEQQRQQELQQQAEESLRQDPGLQGLQDAFDAQVQGVRPIDDLQQKQR